MTPATIGNAASGPFAERCSALGLGPWKVGSDGRAISCVTGRGPVADFFRSSPVHALVADAAARTSPAIEELSPGFWVIRVCREGPGGPALRWCVAALSPTLFEGPLFAAACAEADLPPVDAARELTPWARFDIASLHLAAELLRGTASDLDELGEGREAIRGFTNQLTDSYETIHLLYSLGRAMDDPSRPERFVGFVGSRLLDSTSFGWTATVFGDDVELPGGVRGRVFRAGVNDTPRFEDGARELLASLGDDPSSRVIEGGAGVSSRVWSQVLAQPIVHGTRVVGAILAGDKTGHDPYLSSYDTQLFEAAGRHVSAFLHISALYAAQHDLFLGTLKSLTAAIDAKDRYTRGHSERVAWFSRALALRVGVEPAEAERYHIAGLVHDVGKIGVPEAVLTKPGRLTDEEFGHIKRHPEIGHHILIGIPQMADILPGVLHHHERYDGKGYPRGLSGEAIPLVARIIAVADTFDAMSSTRSYRSARPRTTVLEEIVKSAGTQLDPRLARAATTMNLSDYDRMLAEHAAADPAAQPLAA